MDLSPSYLILQLEFLSLYAVIIEHKKKLLTSSLQHQHHEPETHQQSWQEIPSHEDQQKTSLNFCHLSVTIAYLPS